ncbi:MAG: hypothetical protein ACTSVI_02110 [Promethearchaeota archaeon]
MMKRSPWHVTFVKHVSLKFHRAIENREKNEESIHNIRNFALSILSKAPRISLHGSLKKYKIQAFEINEKDV